jgi:hypothetical protein
MGLFDDLCKRDFLISVLSAQTLCRQRKDWLIRWVYTEFKKSPEMAKLSRNNYQLNGILQFLAVESVYLIMIFIIL